jgi:hypothetical protein
MFLYTNNNIINGRLPRGDQNMKKIIGIFSMMLLITITVLPAVSACTGFTVSENDNILVGANHDWSATFNTYMHTFPAEEGKYGRVIFEFNFPLNYLSLIFH